MSFLKIILIYFWLYNGELYALWHFNFLNIFTQERYIIMQLSTMHAGKRLIMNLDKDFHFISWTFTRFLAIYLFGLQEALIPQLSEIRNVFSNSNYKPAKILWVLHHWGSKQNQNYCEGILKLLLIIYVIIDYGLQTTLMKSLNKLCRFCGRAITLDK